MKKHFLFMFAVIFLICDARATVKITMSEKGEVINVETRVRRKYSAGETFDAESGVLWIEQENRIPVIVYESKVDSHVQLVSPKVEESIRHQKQVIIDSEISEVLLKYSSIQKSIKARRLDSAMEDINQLRVKFPNVAFLDFLEASVAVVKGDTEKAKTLLKRGLSSHPNFEEGKKLLNQLERRE